MVMLVKGPIFRVYADIRLSVFQCCIASITAGRAICLAEEIKAEFITAVHWNYCISLMIL